MLFFWNAFLLTNSVKSLLEVERGVHTFVGAEINDVLGVGKDGLLRFGYSIKSSKIKGELPRVSFSLLTRTIGKQNGEVDSRIIPSSIICEIWLSISILFSSGIR